MHCRGATLTMLRHGCGASRCESGASREPSRGGEPGCDVPRAGEPGAGGTVGAEAKALPASDPRPSRSAHAAEKGLGAHFVAFRAQG